MSNLNTLSQIYQKLYYSSILHHNHHDYQNCDKGSLHSYIDLYEELFEPYRNKPIRLLEIGVQGGISMLMWKEYFPMGDIYGVDLDTKMLQPKVSQEASKPNSRINLMYHDAAIPSFLSKLSGKFDIIIDDGSHHFSHQLASFMILKDLLSSEGTYIIEDIDSTLSGEKLREFIPGSELIDLRHKKGRFDDLVLRYVKK